MSFPNPDKESVYTNPTTGATYRYVNGAWRPNRTVENPESFVRKPYVTYTSDNPPTVGVHEDGQLRNGELWYSTATNELFCYESMLAYPIENDIPIMLIDRARKLNEEEIE